MCGGDNDGFITVLVLSSCTCTCMHVCVHRGLLWMWVNTCHEILCIVNVITLMANQIDVIVHVTCDIMLSDQLA